LRCLVDLKTYIPKLRVWVSTVAYDTPIGADGRPAETMVFKGNSEKITSYEELYFEPHFTTNPEELKKIHESIVQQLKTGEIKLRKQ